ncbi:MAG: PIG-L family deacetylase [bacterium]|nr:PIG-L family deacetylase [bacterium]
MKNNKTLLVFSLVTISIVIILFLGGVFHNNKKLLSKLNENDYKDVDYLIIVAHPDDETLWSFNTLYKNKCLVVCITCGRNKTREKEIEKVVKKTDDKLLSLGYTDKFLNHRSKWFISKNEIKKDLSTIINLKRWKGIITHNKDGEYGHIHHKMIHNMVKGYKNYSVSYFGKYYSKNNINKINAKSIEKYRLDDDVLIKKNETLKIYKSQKKVRQMFKHMVPYENIEYLN